MTVARVDDGRGAVGCLRRGVSTLRDISRYVAFAKAGSAAVWGAWGDLALRCNAGKPCGPKRSADGRARRCRDRGKHPHKTKARKRVSRHFAARGINSPVK